MFQKRMAITRPKPVVGGGTELEWVTNVSFATGFETYNVQGGLKFTTASSAITVTQIGAWMLADSYGSTIPVAIYSDASGTLVSGTSCDIPRANDEAFHYYTLSSPVVLSAGTTYYISLRSSGIALWFDCTLTVRADATCDDTTYWDGGAFAGGGGANHAHGPLSFKYHL